MDRKRYPYDEDRDYAVRSRRRVLEREMERLRQWMLGGQVRVWPYMTDFGGIYSEERTAAFVEEIITEKQFRRMHRTDMDLCVHRISFYRDLLYCVLRTLTSGYTEYQSGNITGFEKPETITFAQAEKCFGREPGGIVDSDTVCFMQMLYRIFAQKEIDLSVLNPGTELPVMTEEMQREMEEAADAWSALEEEAALRQGVGLHEWRALEEQEQEEMRLREERERRRILQEFAGREPFCRRLEQVRNYAAEHILSPPQLREELRTFLFRFLSDRRLLVLDDEEAFIDVMVQLKKTIRAAQRYAED